MVIYYVWRDTMFKKIGLVVGLVLVGIVITFFLTSDKEILADTSVSVAMFNSKIAELENMITELNGKVEQLTEDNTTLTKKINETSSEIVKVKSDITSNVGKI